MTSRLLELAAAVFLGVAAVVIAVAPTIVGTPNALAAPAALITAIGAAGAVIGYRGGRAVAWVVVIAGLVLDALWLYFASIGFGVGDPWVDDMIEAAILVGAFLLALISLVLARRRRPSLKSMKENVIGSPAGR
jgi:hypothetical protein